MPLHTPPRPLRSAAQSGRRAGAGSGRRSPRGSGAGRDPGSPAARSRNRSGSDPRDRSVLRLRVTSSAACQFSVLREVSPRYWRDPPRVRVQRNHELRWTGASVPRETSREERRARSKARIRPSRRPIQRRNMHQRLQRFRPRAKSADTKNDRPPALRPAQRRPFRDQRVERAGRCLRHRAPR